jgi:hypothetical protein
MGCSDPWSSQPYARVRQEARRLGTDGIPALIVDPMPVTELMKSRTAPGARSLESTPGRRLGRFLERVTGGTLIHAPPEVIRQPNRLVQLVNRLVDGNNPWKALTRRLDSEIGGMSGDRGGVTL